MPKTKNSMRGLARVAKCFPLVVAAILAASCTTPDDSEATPDESPSSSITPAEELPYTVLPETFCEELDRATLVDLLGSEGTLHFEDYRDSGADLDLVNQTSYCGFSFSDEESDVSWSMSMNTQIAHFIDPDVSAWEQTYQKDPYDIYSSNNEHSADPYIPAEDLPLPLTRMVDAPGWDQAAVAEFVELDDRGTHWDPNGKAISFEYKLQSGNMLVEFTFQLRGSGLPERPETDPYLQLLTGLADQAKSISAEASE